MIEEDYITFEQAKLLKDKGFPQLGYKFKLYYGHTKNIEYCNDIPDCEINDLLLWYCSTLSLVQKWIREEKNIHICPIKTSSLAGEYYIVEINEETVLHESCPGYYYPTQYETYEEALSAGINKALELI